MYMCLTKTAQLYKMNRTSQVIKNGQVNRGIFKKYEQLTIDLPLLPPVERLVLLVDVDVCLLDQVVNILI